MLKIRRKMVKFACGFTLVETIAANVILCGAVVTLGAIGTVCLTQTKLNSQYETAANLADRQLSLIDYIGVDTFVQEGQFDGEFESTGVKYVWRSDIMYLEIDNLYAIALTISWEHRNKQYSVVVETRLDGAGSSQQLLNQTSQTQTQTTTSTSTTTTQTNQTGR
jgi:hypothetical protein